MDVNGTPHHLLLGRDDWFEQTVIAPAGALEWSDRDHTARLAELPFVFPDRTGDRRLGPADRRGADRDRFGHWYWIGPSNDEILILPAGRDEPTRFWPPTGTSAPEREPGSFEPKDEMVPAGPQRYSGLAVTDHHYLVAGLADLGGLLIFDLHGGGPPTPYTWPGPFQPIDLTSAPDGGVWILDRTEGGPTRYWGLDRNFAVRNLTDVEPEVAPTPDFRRKDGPAGEAETPAGDPVPASAAMGVDVTAIEAISIAAVDDGSVLILDRGAADVGALLHYRGPAPVSAPIPIPALGSRPTDMAVLAGDDEPGHMVLVAEEQGDQAFAFTFDPAGGGLQPLNRYLPMRLFTGKGLVAAGGEAYYDMGDRWLSLVDRMRPRYLSSAELQSPMFDSVEPGTTWHRLLIDGEIPPGTAVRVESRANDDPGLLADLDWVPEPPLYRRSGDSELGYHRFGSIDGTTTGTWELLFQRATGRHLQIRLTIEGNGRTTPRLWSLRAYGPRFSYLREYLPDAYREDGDSASFLDRYLANVEGMLTSFESRIEQAQVLFDISTIDGRYLDWLAGWLGAALDPGWDDARQRLFIRHAFELFGRRGTRRGLIEAIRLAIDPCPTSAIFDPASAQPFGVRFVERFRTRLAPGIVFGDPTDLTGPRMIDAGEKWDLADGRDDVDRRYRDFLTDRHGAGAVTLDQAFPPLTPSEAGERSDRIDFIDEQLAVSYDEVTAADVGAYRTFLHQRYRRPSVLNEVHNLAGASAIEGFEDVALPTVRLPADGPPLHDWIQFVSLHLPMTRASHRFTVLVPIRPEDDDAMRTELLETVGRIVDAERPAHTAYEVKPYWAAFRVGEVRLGLETVVGEGSRFVAMVLGYNRVAQAYLSGAHPWNADERFVVGREALTSGDQP